MQNQFLFSKYYTWIPFRYDMVPFLTKYLRSKFILNFTLMQFALGLDRSAALDCSDGSAARLGFAARGARLKVCLPTLGGPIFC